MRKKFEYYINNKQYFTDDHNNISLNKLHREDGPSYIEYVREKPFNSQWYWNGKRHRLDGPAFIHYNSNGEIKHEHWFKNNLLHREDGPAIINYELQSEVYYIDNIRYSKKHFFFLVKNKQNKNPGKWSADFKMICKLKFS